MDGYKRNLSGVPEHYRLNIQGRACDVHDVVDALDPPHYVAEALTYLMRYRRKPMENPDVDLSKAAHVLLRQIFRGDATGSALRRLEGVARELAELREALAAQGSQEAFYGKAPREIRWRLDAATDAPTEGPEQVFAAFDAYVDEVRFNIGRYLGLPSVAEANDVEARLALVKHVDAIHGSVTFNGSQTIGSVVCGYKALTHLLTVLRGGVRPRQAVCQSSAEHDHCLRGAAAVRGVGTYNAFYLTTVLEARAALDAFAAFVLEQVPSCATVFRAADGAEPETPGAEELLETPGFEVVACCCCRLGSSSPEKEAKAAAEARAQEALCRANDVRDRRAMARFVRCAYRFIQTLKVDYMGLPIAHTDADYAVVDRLVRYVESICDAVDAAADDPETFDEVLIAGYDALVTLMRNVSMALQESCGLVKHLSNVADAWKVRFVEWRPDSGSTLDYLHRLMEASLDRVRLNLDDVAKGSYR